MEFELPKVPTPDPVPADPVRPFPFIFGMSIFEQGFLAASQFDQRERVVRLNGTEKIS